MSLDLLFSREGNSIVLYARNIIIKGGKHTDYAEFISGMKDWEHLYRAMNRLGV